MSPSKVFPLLAETHFPFTYDLSLINAFKDDVVTLRTAHCWYSFDNDRINPWKTFTYVH